MYKSNYEGPNGKTRSTLAHTGLAFLLGWSSVSGTIEQKVEESSKPVTITESKYLETKEAFYKRMKEQGLDFVANYNPNKSKEVKIGSQSDLTGPDRLPLDWPILYLAGYEPIVKIIDDILSQFKDLNYSHIVSTEAFDEKGMRLEGWLSIWKKPR